MHHPPALCILHAPMPLEVGAAGVLTYQVRKLRHDDVEDLVPDHGCSCPAPVCQLLEGGNHSGPIRVPHQDGDDPRAPESDPVPE